MTIQIDHLKFGLVWYLDGHCIKINIFLQNNFNIDELSSSDGGSVTISIEPAAQQPSEPAEPQQAEPQQAEPQPAARTSKRVKVPRTFLTM